MSTTNPLTRSSFWKKTPLRGLFVTSLVLNILTVGIFLILLKFLPPVTPFLYGRPSGEGQLVPTLFLLSAPAISIIFTIINGVISSFTSDLFTKKLLIVTTFLLSLLTTITVLKIIFLVGFF